MVMRRLLTISSLIGLSISAPADTCDDQLGCLEVTRDELEGGSRYRVCLKLNNNLSGCKKDGTISHACYSRLENEKIEGWGNNYNENPMCKIVDCGTVAEFGLKDGRGCSKTQPLLGQTISGIDGISCGYEDYQGYCGGGNNQDCVWIIPTPECESDEPVCEDPNKEFNECGTACPPKCGDGDEPKFCILPCIPECQCKSGYVLDDYGNCILKENCPTPQPTTSSPTTASPTTASPTTASPTIPTCDDNEIYNPCGSQCDRTCDEPNPICDEVCQARCECRDNYVYSDGVCIPQLACPSPIPTCAATTCEEGVGCCYNNDGSGGCGFRSDDNGGCEEEPVEPGPGPLPEPGCGSLPYGATQLPDDRCGYTPGPYKTDPCTSLYIDGTYGENMNVVIVHHHLMEHMQIH
eukprot:CAMPEP_0201565118 /NCGR_PEP_ID=MMETSP0190_2-20130828/3964_1 /ASSEMBLY_ACC=CAM_ASM_000263 /TAXON_ID=37353 /ORGANISM="Rosalina sp." /LENGTH=407 /DNA_ID=CAMNT_0047982199 /DNA_START=71 /DNA_END=1295 /DNA_ORIENTATION=+